MNDWHDWHDYLTGLRRLHPRGSRGGEVLDQAERCLGILREAAPGLPPPQAGPGEGGLAESMELAWAVEGARLDIDVRAWAVEYAYREGSTTLRAGLWYIDRPIWPELAWAARKMEEKDHG